MSAQEQLLPRIHGCLAGIAVGDALGFPAHDLAVDEVLVRFDGMLDRLMPAFDDDVIHVGYEAGRITDDTILTLVTVEAIVEAKGRPIEEDMALALYRWAAENESLWRPGCVFGPSTKKALDALLASGGRLVVDLSRGRAHDGASNGAPMRMAPAGLVHPGDPEAAAMTACLLTLPTHPTHVAISAAAALASAVAVAVCDSADVQDVLDAARLGARLGDAWGRTNARLVPAPDVARRIDLALDLAGGAVDVLEAARLLHAVIGGNLPAAEALPVSLGIFAAAHGDATTAMVAAATAGGDSDTIASMSGGLCGALRGIGAIREDWLADVERVNSLDLSETARRLAACVVAVPRERAAG
jgi:ADP-ribosylglycohydrolase